MSMLTDPSEAKESDAMRVENDTNEDEDEDEESANESSAEAEADASPQSPVAGSTKGEEGQAAADESGENPDENMEKELEKERQIFNSLFSTRRPKDGWAGLSSGLKSAAKGTCAGFASLIAQPVVGAKNGGFGGFLTGLATGVASCVALPVTGVCVGTMQVSRGIYNSVEAVSASSQGMVWNDDSREWYYYRLDEEAEQVREIDEQKKLEEEEGKTSSRGPSRNVKDDTYYKLLGVPTNANQSQIKKAYYVRARKCHPDKNPGDPTAPAKFQELGHAYQVLANEQTRAAYDRDGLDDSTENKLQMKDIDPYVFFAVMFGSEAVQPYIGELWIASKAETLLKDSKMAQELATNMKNGAPADDPEAQSKREEHVRQLLEEDEFAQRKRQVNCAINLRRRIQPFVDGEDGMDESEFVVMVQAEAAKICQTSFGHVFCTAIGKTLELEAIEFLGFSKNVFGNWDAHAASFQKQAASWSNNIKVINAGIAAVRAGSQAMKQVEKAQKEDQTSATSDGKPASPFDSNQTKETMEKLEDTLPAILELAWAFNVRDINRTLKKVCHKLFYDASVEKEIRWKRAEAVRILGREFFAIGKASEITRNLSENGGDKDEIKLRAEIAAMTTLAKAQGQEISEKEAEFLIRQQRQMKQQQTLNKEASAADNTASS